MKSKKKQDLKRKLNVYLVFMQKSIRMILYSSFSVKKFEEVLFLMMKLKLLNDMRRTNSLRISFKTIKSEFWTSFLSPREP